MVLDLVRVELVDVVVVVASLVVFVSVIAVAVGLGVSVVTAVVIASMSAVVVVAVVIGFGGSAGLKKSSGFGIVMPGNTVIPALVGIGFATIVVIVVFAYVVVGTSFAIVVVVVGATTAAVVVVAVMAVVDFGGSAGLNRSNGFGTVIPRKRVMSDLVGVGLSVEVVVDGVGLKDRVETTAASSAVMVSSFDLEGDGDEGGTSLTGLCGRALVVVDGRSLSLVVIEGTIGGMVTIAGGVVKTCVTTVATLSGMRTVVIS